MGQPSSWIWSSTSECPREPRCGVMPAMGRRYGAEWEPSSVQTGHRGCGISVSPWVGFPTAGVRHMARSGVRVAGRPTLSSPHCCPHSHLLASHYVERHLGGGQNSSSTVRLCHAMLFHAVLCRVVPCHTTLCHAMLCHAVPRRAVFCHAVPCCAMLCHVMPCCAMFCHVVPCYAMLCHAVPHYAMLCHAVLRYAMPHHVVPCCATLCCAVPCHIVPYCAILCHAVPYHAMLCRVVPCGAVLFHVGCATPRSSAPWAQPCPLS